MRKFYQLYKLKEVKTQLSWSHYRELLLVDDPTVRLKLENLAIREGWSRDDLLKRVKQALAGKPEKSESENQNEPIKERLKPYAAPQRSSIEFIDEAVFILHFTKFFVRFGTVGSESGFRFFNSFKG